MKSLLTAYSICLLLHIHVRKIAGGISSIPGFKKAKASTVKNRQKAKYPPKHLLMAEILSN